MFLALGRNVQEKKCEWREHERESNRKTAKKREIKQKRQDIGHVSLEQSSP